MNFRISPLWYPLIGVASPIIIPWLVAKNNKFKRMNLKAFKLNNERIEKAKLIELPEVDSLEITVLVEWKTKEGFLGDAGVSYLFKTELGSMLYDIGFGLERPTLLYNANKLNIKFEEIDDLTISHLHIDHMGGIKAARKNQVIPPKELAKGKLKKCFLPDKAKVDGFESILVKEPQLLNSGIASTGPLACSLFFMGYTEEQALIIKVKDKGLVIFTGCGHPGIENILKMIRKISDDPIYAIGGGLHLPITEGRGDKVGIKFQRILGTGKCPWEKIGLEDLNKTIESINRVNPAKVYLSAHDTCDYSLDYLSDKLNAKVHILKAGGKYKF